MGSHRGRCRSVLAPLLLIGEAAAAAVVVAAPPASAGSAASLYVSSGSTGSACTKSDPCGSVQTAVNVASAGSFANDDVTIDVGVGTFSEADTIDASSLGSLTINGSGITSTVIDGGNKATVFTVEDGTVGLSNLTIEDGSGSVGGGVANTADLSLVGVTLSNNSASDGGAIASYGTLSVTNSTISSNDAIGATSGNGLGGALFNAENATASLTNDSVVDNEATGTYANSAGIQNYGSLTVSASDLSGNDSAGSGALVNADGTATLTSDTINENVGSEEGGGVVAVQGTVNISESQLSGDSTSGHGGGILVEPDGTTFLNGDTLANDTANGSTSSGGAIFNSGQLTVDSSTLSGDGATAEGGGILNDTTAHLTNDTLTNDTATDFDGGALENGGTAVLVDNTLSSDTAPAGGGIANSGSATISDSVIDAAPCDGTLTDGGYNVESENTCGLAATSIVDSSTIHLASSLGANSLNGPETLSITRKSSALEEVPSASCSVTMDERGLPRPGFPGAPCDAGAYEYQQRPVIASPSTLPPGVIGKSYSYTFGVVDGTAPYAWTALSKLPKGLTLSTGGVLSGKLKATLSSGQHSFSVQVADKKKRTASANFTLELSSH
jgi:hypothetical protein